MFFPVVMCGCEGWTIKKAERQRTDAFELWCWWRLLRVPWTLVRSNQSILREISPEYSLEGLMLKLLLQYSGHLMQRTDSLERLILGKTEGRRRRGWQRMRWLDGWHHRLNGHEFEQTPEDGAGVGSLACCSPWGCKESDTTEWLNNNNKSSTVNQGKGGRHISLDFIQKIWKRLPQFPCLQVEPGSRTSRRGKWVHSWWVTGPGKRDPSLGWVAG